MTPTLLRAGRRSHFERVVWPIGCSPSLTRTAAHVCLAVQDQGIGIPESARVQIFDRFYRAPNVDPQQISGLGIGLFIIKDIVTQHGGTITVTSTEGAESTFTMCLPLIQSRLEG